MKIKLKDNDGRVIQEVEVDDAFGEWYIEEERKQENEERRHRYWVTVSLDSLEYEGEWFADPSPTPAEIYEREEEQRRVDEFMSTLTEVQRRRLQMKMNDPDCNLNDIAKKEGVAFKQIKKSFDQIRKKYETFYGRGQ